MPTQLVSDSLSLSDKQSLKYSVSYNDYLSLIDSVQFSAGPNSRQASDNIILNDYAQVISYLNRLFSDVLVLSDVAAIAFPGLSMDSFSFGDSVSVGLSSIFSNINVFSSDGISLDDYYYLSGFGLNPEVGDSLNLSDSIKILFNSDLNSYLRGYLNDQK